MQQPEAGQQQQHQPDSSESRASTGPVALQLWYVKCTRSTPCPPSLGLRLLLSLCLLLRLLLLLRAFQLHHAHGHQLF